MAGRCHKKAEYVVRPDRLSDPLILNLLSQDGEAVGKQEAGLASCGLRMILLRFVATEHGLLCRQVLQLHLTMAALHDPMNPDDPGALPMLQPAMETLERTFCYEIEPMMVRQKTSCITNLRKSRSALLQDPTHALSVGPAPRLTPPGSRPAPSQAPVSPPVPAR